MTYDLSSNVTCQSPGSACPAALSGTRESSILKLVFMAALMIVVLYDSTHVAGAQDQRAIRQACAADYRSLCSDVQPGGGRILACLKQNAAKLSPPCQKVVASAKPQ